MGRVSEWYLTIVNPRERYMVAVGDGLNRTYKYLGFQVSTRLLGKIVGVWTRLTRCTYRNYTRRNTPRRPGMIPWHKKRQTRIVYGIDR